MIPLIRSRRLPPSSILLHNWAVVAAMVGIRGALGAWDWPSCTEPILPGKIDYSSYLTRRRRYVDATGSEIGIYPVLEAILIDGIVTSKRPDLLVIPQFKIPPPSGSSVDFSITVEVSISSTVMSYMYMWCMHMYNNLS